MTVERSVKVAGVVDTIEAAFAFVVNAMDREKLSAVRVVISPILVCGNAQFDRLRRALHARPAAVRVLSRRGDTMSVEARNLADLQERFLLQSRELATLRAQVEQLTAERDRYRDHGEQMRQLADVEGARKRTYQSLSESLTARVGTLTAALRGMRGPSEDALRYLSPHKAGYEVFAATWDALRDALDAARAALAEQETTE